MEDQNEKMINRILHHKEGDIWVPYTIEALSIAFVAMRKRYESYKDSYNELYNILKSIEKDLRDL
jgi:hypothetical protein